MTAGAVAGTGAVHDGEEGQSLAVAPSCPHCWARFEQELPVGPLQLVVATQVKASAAVAAAAVGLAQEPGIWQVRAWVQRSLVARWAADADLQHL